ncbi:hypothetical protein DOTSEDRAFT_49860 [Lecanosticta acicola]|uniref:Cep57 centrosome microtubule-binding domain-containing protein n=1 Tax=Lecanosticta acicola TaxID=111012 RepID=A0AAI8Z7E0_9PEZI|nr:hypothetical protein DOTSEDRAFT_49860 [Lecanosticta acicola]
MAAFRARMSGVLPNSIDNSPADDNVFTTATSFQHIIHSTPQRNMDDSGGRSLPLHYDQYPDSEASADMSIEIGRGVQNGTRQEQGDMSSDAIFSFGNDNSQYEIAGTPPVRARPNQRRADGQLRKEASVRRATESTKANDALKRNTSSGKQRAVSDNSPRLHFDDETEDIIQPTATFRVKSSRFSSGQHVSASYGGLPSRFTADGGLQFSQQTPRRQNAVSGVAESTTQSAKQSFMLPDLPNMTELISGVRMDGTPVFQRRTASRSRFTSASYRTQTQTHIPVNGVPIPEEEKAIVASLNMLHDRVAQLEMDKSEAQKRIEEYEGEIIDLRSQLHVASRRPDSALGSDDDTGETRGAREEKARLQAKVKALQDRLDRTERKVSVSEIAVTRVTRERDAMLAQIGSAYYQNEELVKENQSLRESHGDLQAENEDLKAELEELRNGNAKLHQQASLAKGTMNVARAPLERKRSVSKAGGPKASKPDREEAEQSGSWHTRQSRKKSDLSIHHKTESRSFPALDGENGVARKKDCMDSAFVNDLASRIEQEVRKYRDEAAARAQGPAQTQEQTLGAGNARSRSKSRTHKQAVNRELSIPRRPASAPSDVEFQEREATTELDLTRMSQRSHARNRAVDEDDSDRTELSDLDAEAVANLRRKLEEERRLARLSSKQQAATTHEDGTTRSATRQSLPRKSSLKDVTSRTDDGTHQFSLHGATMDDIVKGQKTVRVQSPHSSFDVMDPEAQDGADQDVSILSNTSRRRRRTASVEGMTSAFIIPDITMNASQALPAHVGNTCIQHDAQSCTLCTKDGKSVEIHMPIPVTDREEMGDVTNATIRPSQSPALALATVIKNLEDEVVHLKMQREGQNRLYNQHDPALSKRKRQNVKSEMDRLTELIEKRSDQVYALFDVVEGQKQAAEAARARGEEVDEMNDQDVEETLNSIGLDPAELSGRVGRKAPEGLEEMDGMSDESELPWEGLSDVE